MNTDPISQLATTLNELTLDELDCHFTWAENTETSDKEQIRKQFEICVKHIQRTPDPSVYNFLGFLYYQQKNYPQAEKAFREALKLAENEPVALANLVYFYNRQNRKQEGKLHLDKLRSLSDAAKTAWQNWSRAYFYVRHYKYEEAIQCYKNAIHNISGLPEPYHYKVYLYMGIACTRLSKSYYHDKKYDASVTLLEKALTNLKKAEDLNSDDYLIFCHLGVVYSYLKINNKINFNVALNYFMEALKRKPNDATTLKFLGKLLASRKNKKNEALELFNQSIASEETSSAYHNRAIFYNFQGQLNLAQQDFEKAIELDSNNFYAMMGLIEVYIKKELYQNALTYCQSVIMVSPTIYWLCKLADLLVLTGNEQDAAEQYTALLAKPDLEEVYQNKAKTYLFYYYQSQWKQTKNVTPLIAEINLHLKFKNDDLACKRMYEGLQVHPENFFLNENYGLQLILKQDYRQAATYLWRAFNLTNNGFEKRACFKIIKKTYDDINSQSGLPKDIKIFFRELAAQIELKLHENDRVLWHKTLDVIYPSKKPHKTITVKGDELHQKLRREIDETYKKNFQLKPPPNNLNYASFRLTFIVSDRPHNETHREHGRKKVSVPLLIEKRDSIIHVMDQYPLFKYDGTIPRSTALLQDVLDSTPMAKHDSVIKKYEEEKPEVGFQRDYHCSERAAYALLTDPHTVQVILNHIENQCEKQKSLKFYACIIDIHTEHYFCNKCKESVFFWYNPDGKFINQFIQAALARGHKVQSKTNSLSVAVRVSAKRPAGGQIKATLEQHQTEPVSFKNLGPNILFLQRDDGVINTTLSNAIFTNHRNKFR